MAHQLGIVLASAYTHSNISLDIFRLCCASIGLGTSEYGRQLVGKLNMKLKAREPLNNCEGALDTINRLEALGYRSLTELASLHELCLQSIPDHNDARGAIMNHFISGECGKTNGAITLQVSPIPHSTSSRPFILLTGGRT